MLLKSMDDLMMAMPEDRRPGDRIPTELRDMAYSPVCRGMEYGPSGLGCYQLEARNAVISGLQGHMPALWRECLTSSLALSMLEKLRLEGIQCYECPRCTGII